MDELEEGSDNDSCEDSNDESDEEQSNSINFEQEI